MSVVWFKKFIMCIFEENRKFRQFNLVIDEKREEEVPTQLLKRRQIVDKQIK